jgi:translation initiation factor 4E
MWEDPANANVCFATQRSIDRLLIMQGGKWVVLLRNAPHLMDFAWANLVMGLIGNTLDPDDAVCGIVASSRPKVDRVQLWTRSRADADADSLNALGQRIMDCMGLDANDQSAMSIEFQVSSTVLW